MLQGKVKWFDAAKGFGFIESGGKDYFVHFKNIVGTGYKSLEANEPVQFELFKTDKGMSATNVTRLLDA